MFSASGFRLAALALARATTALWRTEILNTNYTLKTYVRTVVQRHLYFSALWCQDKKYAELFYAIIPTLLSILLSLHLVTFLAFFFPVLFVSFFSSRCMLKLSFGIYHRAASLSSYAAAAGFLALIGTIDLGITLSALTEESRTQASIQAPSQPFSWWMTKPALPAWILMKFVLTLILAISVISTQSTVCSTLTVFLIQRSWVMRMFHC